MGKLHGNLAKAGKVKNQTPVVAPTEDKPKKLSGRVGMRSTSERRKCLDGKKPNEQKDNEKI